MKRLIPLIGCLLAGWHVLAGPAFQESPQQISAIGGPGSLRATQPDTAVFSASVFYEDRLGDRSSYE